MSLNAADLSADSLLPNTDGRTLTLHRLNLLTFFLLLLFAAACSHSLGGADLAFFHLIWFGDYVDEMAENVELLMLHEEAKEEIATVG